MIQLRRTDQKIPMGNKTVKIVDVMKDGKKVDVAYLYPDGIYEFGTFRGSRTRVINHIESVMP